MFKEINKLYTSFIKLISQSMYVHTVKQNVNETQNTANFAIDALNDSIIIAHGFIIVLVAKIT